MVVDDDDCNGKRFCVVNDDGRGGKFGGTLYGGGGSLLINAPHLVLFDDAEVNVIDDSGGNATVNWVCVYACGW